MFNLDNFKLLLFKHHYSKEQLAKRLGISVASLYRRIANGGNFTAEEVRIMISLFGKKDVFNALFN